MTAAEERAYGAGQRQVWTRLLQEALRHLGTDDPAVHGQAWVLEREAALAVLRRLCAAHGDNAWPDELHLEDILTKHLEAYLADDRPVTRPRDAAEP